jgi:Response regulator containing CheY-like receiver, AAA-type ATPase, and DNA-binding domains
MPDTLVSLHEAVSAFKRGFILHVLSQFDGNRSRTAAALGIERTSLLRLIRDLGIASVPRPQRGRPAASTGDHGSMKVCPRCHVDLLRTRVLESFLTQDHGRAS